MKIKFFLINVIIIYSFSLSNLKAQTNYAIEFNGLQNSKWVKINDHPSLDPTNSITLEGWIKPSQYPSDFGFVVSKSRNIGDREWDFMVLNNGKIRFSLFRDNDSYTNPVLIYSNSTIPLNKWTHIACTYSHNTGFAKIYINGIVDKVENVGIFNFASTQVPVLIGAYWDSYLNNITRGNFNGVIDEIRIWNVELTANQIQSNLCSSLSGSENGLVAYYPLDEGSGTFTEDKSLNNNHGTLYNNPLWIGSNIIPSANAGVDKTICAGESANLQAAGGEQYQWSTGQNTATIIISPLLSTTYTVIINNHASCFSTDEVVITVNPSYHISQNITIDYNQTFYCGGTYQNQTGIYYDSLVTNLGCDSIIITHLTVNQPLVTEGNYALQFNGIQNGQWVKINDHPSFDPSNNITLEAYIKPTAVPSEFAFIASKSRNIGEREWDFMFLANSKIRFSLFRSNDAFENPVLVYSNSTVPLNTWTHIACTYSNATGLAKIYINGVLDKTENVGVFNLASTPVPVLIGAYWYDYITEETRGNFNGIIDEVRIWNVERTNEQISSSKCTSLIGNETGLVAYYPLNEGSGSFTEDKSLNENNGVLVNSPLWVSGSVTLVSAGNDAIICEGSSITLTATGGNSYVWNTGQQTSEITITPAANVTYTVSVTTPLGCSATDEVVIYVNPLPQPTIYGDLNYCGNSTTIFTDNYPVIQWSNGATSNSIQATMADNPITVTVTDTNGCVGTSSPINVNHGGAGSLNGVVVYSGGYIGNGDGNAHLFKAGPNGHHQLQASSPIGNNGSFSFTNIPLGNYYLCVKLDNHANYQHVHDSYYDSTFKWQDAHILNIDCAYDSTIIMHMFETGPQAVGSGNISGVTRYVTPSTSGSSKNYTPVVGANIYLLNDLNNQLISYTATIEDGSYKVCEIPDGNYTIYVDLPGFSMIETYSNITLNSANNLFSGFDFYVDTTYATAGIYIDEATKTLTFTQNDYKLSIYPNPAKDNLNFNYTLNKDSKVCIELIDMQGKKVALLSEIKQIEGNHTLLFNIKELGFQGSYILKFSVNHQVYLKKLILQ